MGCLLNESTVAYAFLIPLLLASAYARALFVA